MTDNEIRNTFTVTTWGQFGGRDPLGTIRVQKNGIDSRYDLAARSIARRLGLHVVTLRPDGQRIERNRAVESHFVTTLGTPTPGGGWTPEAEVWFSIPA